MSGIITANIGGKERSLKFGTNSTSHYCEVRGCDLDDYVNDVAKLLLSMTDKSENRSMQGLGGGEARDMIYSGLWAYDITHNAKIDYNRLTVGDWIDEAEQEEINSIFQSLFSSNEGKVKPPKSEGSKKK